MDRLNEQFYQENKARPLNEVLGDFQSAHTNMLAAVQTMTDEDLTDPHRFAWTDGKPLWQFKTSSSVNSTAITYTRNGRQYVTVASGLGGGLATRAANNKVPTGGSLWTFALTPE